VRKATGSYQQNIGENRKSIGNNDRGKDSISATGKRILYSVGIQNRRIILCMMQK
jgi:hypothetical protein